MSPVRRCTPSRPVHPARLPLGGPEDALSVLLAGAAPDRPVVACLLLDDEHRGITFLEVSGRSDADAVFNVAGVLLQAAAADTGLGAAVLATFRPGAGHLPEPGETSSFIELRELLADSGIELLDWFVVAEGYASSLAELSDAPWLWRSPPGGPPP